MIFWYLRLSHWVQKRAIFRENWSWTRGKTSGFQFVSYGVVVLIFVRYRWQLVQNYDIICCLENDPDLGRYCHLQPILPNNISLKFLGDRYQLGPLTVYAALPNEIRMKIYVFQYIYDIIWPYYIDCVKYVPISIIYFFLCRWG